MLTRNTRFAFIGLLMAALLLAGCSPSQPKVVTDTVAAAESVAGEDRVRVASWDGEHAGWQVLVLNEDPDAVRAAVLTLFDGRGYAIEEEGGETVVAGAVVVDPWDPGAASSGMTSIWLPASALGEDGYPSP